MHRTHSRRNLASLALLLASSSPLIAQDRPAAPSAGRGAPKAAATAPGAATSTPAPKRAAADPGVQKAATPLQGGKVDPEAQRKMDDLLAKWEAKSGRIKTLSVKYRRKDVSTLFNVVKVYRGEARFTSDNRAYLDFWEVAEAGKPEVMDERIVCDGEKVYQFKGATKQAFVFPLPQNGQQKALQQGPLPFLFNMKADEAKKRYAMTLVGEKNGSHWIQIIPLLAIDREEYSQAELLLGLQDLRPVAIRLTSPNGKDTKTFSFEPKDVVENGKISDAWFDAAKMTADLRKVGWKVIDNPEAGDAPQPAPAPAIGARPAAGRPATKGQGGVRQK